jgi:LuxR family maltose regulon positive regulatory protein
VADSLLAVARARLLHANGEFAGSRATLGSARASLAPRRAPAWVTNWIDLTAAVHAAAEGGQGPEEPDGRICLELEEWHGDAPLELQISLALDDAGFWLREGDETSAVSLLAKALGLAAPEQIRRPFTEAPPAVRQLLRNRDELQTAHPWLTTAADPVGRPRETAEPKRTDGRPGRPGPRRPLPALESRGVSRPLVVEPLTSKELEVLGYLNDLATTAEIGAAMFISVNTVRTHVRNLLRKLGADRRNDAVRRAWELGLLADPHGSDPADVPGIRGGRSA